MNRSTGVTVAAVLTFSGAMILALGSCAFFVVGVMVATGDEGGAPVSVAITGMALGGGFMLLILAGAAGWIALNAGEVREWARTLSFAGMAASIERGMRGVSAAVRQRRASAAAGPRLPMGATPVSLNSKRGSPASLRLFPSFRSR
jgi:hypothetical protein